MNPAMTLKERERKLIAVENLLKDTGIKLAASRRPVPLLAVSGKKLILSYPLQPGQDLQKTEHGREKEGV